jgi:hypothetical protein
MQDIDLDDVRKFGYLPVPFSPLVTHGFLDLGDFAAVAAAILRARPSMHAQTRYELVGDLKSYREVAQLLSETVCMQINAVRLERDAAVQRQVMLGRLGDAHGCDAFARMIAYHEEQYVGIRFELS